MNFKKAIKRGALIGAMAMFGAGTPAAADDTIPQSAPCTENGTTRKTVGILVKELHQRSLSEVHKFTIISYHIDTDNDGRADVIRYRMIPDGASNIMYEPGSLVELNEVRNGLGGYTVDSVTLIMRPQINQIAKGKTR